MGCLTFRMWPRLYFCLLHLNTEKLSNIHYYISYFFCALFIRYIRSCLFICYAFLLLLCLSSYAVSSVWRWVDWEVHSDDDGVIMCSTAHVPLKLSDESAHKSFTKATAQCLYRCLRSNIKTLNSLRCVLIITENTETALGVENRNARALTFALLCTERQHHNTTYQFIHSHCSYFKRKHCSLSSLCVSMVTRLFSNACGCCHLSMEINRFPANMYKHNYMHITSHPFLLLCSRSPYTHTRFFGEKKLFHYSLFSHCEKIPQLFGCTIQFD